MLLPRDAQGKKLHADRSAMLCARQRASQVALLRLRSAIPRSAKVSVLPPGNPATSPAVASTVPFRAAACGCRPEANIFCTHGDSNFPAERIANLDASTAHWIKLAATKDGSFRVLNGRTGEWKDYPAQ
jgi:hypothetical protein